MGRRVTCGAGRKERIQMKGSERVRKESGRKKEREMQKKVYET